MCWTIKCSDLKGGPNNPDRGDPAGMEDVMEARKIPGVEDKWQDRAREAIHDIHVYTEVGTCLRQLRALMPLLSYHIFEESSLDEQWRTVFQICEDQIYELEGILGDE